MTRAGINLTQDLDAQRLDERRLALLALLRRPLLSPHGAAAEAFVLVRRHAQWLQEWLERYPNWPLRVDSRCARLHKTPAEHGDATRGAVHRRTGSDQPFTRRRYGLLCLALAAIEQADRQTTLGVIADRVLGSIAHDDLLQEIGFAFDLKSRDQREDMVHAMRLLVAWGVLRRVDGDEQRFIGDGTQDVLYDVDRDAATAMLVVRQGPSLVTEADLDRRIARITREPAAETEDGRVQRCRANLYRRLLDDPVVYFEDLPPDERAYWTSQRGRVLRTIEQATGLVAELRREGVAMVDEKGTATDMSVTEEGTDGHVTLLLAEYLAGHLRDRGEVAVGRTALQAHLAGLMPEHRSYWRKDATLPGAEVTLVEQTLHRLRGLNLVRLEGEGVIPRPAIARYALAGVRVGRSAALYADSEAV